MQDAEYPALYQSADSASLWNQSWHLGLVRISLLCLVAIAAIGSIPHQPSIRTLAWVVAVLAILKFIVTLLMGSMKLEEGWFDGRAVAESVKTATWRYMMRARPYEDGVQDPDALFLSELAEIRRSRPGIEGRLASHPSSALPITDRMTTTRSLTLEERRDVYLAERVNEQRQWYDNKSAFNDKRSKQAFALSAVLDVTALVFAVLQASGTLGTALLYGLAATLGASLFTWVKLKRYRDLATAYQLAAQELTSLSHLVARASEQDGFGDLVEQAEGAISREHTMWYAKYR